jgi:hypothetical protein
LKGDSIKTSGLTTGHFLYQDLTLPSQALVAHACNPSYLGCRDQEDCGSKPAWVNSF